MKTGLLIYTWVWSSACKAGCSGCWGWAQLPLSLAAMQCSNSRHLPFCGLTPCMRASDTSLISTKSSYAAHFCRTVILKRKKRENDATQTFYDFFSIFYLLFHFAYSQQFIHSTVIIVLAFADWKSETPSFTCLEKQHYWCTTSKTQVFLKLFICK